MNGWFPKINSLGQIVSGSDGIWITDENTSIQVSNTGTGPVWAGSVIVFNANNGTTSVGETSIPVAYNENRGSDDDRWAGFLAPNNGHVDVYRGTERESSIDMICCPRFGGSKFAYLTPYQAEWRNLIISNIVVAHERIIDVQLSRNGEFFVYATATGTYTRQILDKNHVPVNITDHEAPLIAFVGPNHEEWLMTGNGESVFVRPIYSNIGYEITGELYYPDARMIGDKLRIVGSYSNGTPRFDIWVDFNQPRIDLRTIGEIPVEPPVIPPVIPPIEPPVVEPPDPEEPDMAKINPEDYRRDWNLPHVDVWTTTEYPQLAAAYHNCFGHDPNDNWAAFQTYRRYMEPHVWTFEKMLAWETNCGQAPPEPEPPFNPAVQSLRVDGPVFRTADNAILQLKGFTSFPLLNRFEQGMFVENILDEFKGYNAPRIFLYTPKKDWGADYWELPSPEAAYEGVKHLNSLGFYPKITLATDDDMSKLQGIEDIFRYLESHNDIVLMWEAVNEPFIHEKHDPSIFKNLLSSSKFLYTSGVYTDNKLFYGKFWNDHSPRDSEWYRKGGHNIYEAYHGGGPSFPDEPALRRAGIQDEPIKPHEHGYNVNLTYQYAASCSLFGNGTYHCESAKFCRPLNQGEKDCRDAFLRGLSIFPAEAPLAIDNYNRIEEPGNEYPNGDNQSGRTYILGNYSVRIHQKGLNHPWGWKSLDDLGVAFVKP